MRKRFTFFKSSGVARLGHTGAHALATRGRAPPVQVCNQIISADGIVVDRKTGTTLTVYASLPYVTYTAPQYSLRTDCKFFSGRAPPPPLRAEDHTNVHSVPMLCPTIDAVLATPLFKWDVKPST